MIKSANYLVKTILLLMTSAAMIKANPPSINYYDLMKLEKASGPRYLEIIKADNSGTEKKIISKGIVFTYSNRKASDVNIAGSFSNWAPVKMFRNQHGIWFYFLESPDTDTTMKYKFMVDNIWIKDPNNSIYDSDGMGGQISLVQPTERMAGKQLSYKITGKNEVEFRIYMPGASLISLVGDFNNWNPENDLMQKDRSGVWHIKKHMLPGTFRYCFIIDGKYEPDYYNTESGTGPVGDICSIITLP